MIWQGARSTTIAITNFDDKLSYGWRAEATALLGDAPSAEADFEKALKAAPDDPLFWYYALCNAARLKNRTKQKRRATALVKLDATPGILAFARIILADLEKQYENVAQLSLDCLDEFGEDDLVLTPMLDAAEASLPARQMVLRRLPGLVDTTLKESPYAHFCLGFLLILDGDSKASKVVLERCAQYVLPEIRADIEKNLKPLTLLCDALGALERQHLAEAVRLGEEASNCQGDLFPGLECAVGWMQYTRGKAMTPGAL